MRRNLLALAAFLLLASTAQAFDISNSAWANMRGSYMQVPQFRSPPFDHWVGYYSSSETTTPQQCRGVSGQILMVYETGTPAWSAWTLNWPPNVQSKFDYHFHAHEFDNQRIKLGCSEETVWAVSVAENPLRLCTIWSKRLASGQVVQGRDVFWSVATGSLPLSGPYVWPRGYGIKRNACRPITKYFRGQLN